MKRLIQVTISSIALLCAAESFAHESGGYSHDSEAFIKNKQWMKYVPDSTHLSHLSIPGSHDTMAYKISTDALGLIPGYGIFADVVKTQSMNLETQLNAGIRALDIRIGHNRDDFRIHHGDIDLNSNFYGTLTTINAFLDKYPSETVIMRLKRDHESGTHTWDFETRFGHYMYYLGQNVYKSSGAVTDPTLGNLRGKILIMDDFPGTSDYAPMQYSSPIKQDDYTLSTNWDLYSKWTKIKKHFNDGNTTSGVYINYLSASSGSFPYFVASGHSSSATGAPRLATGLTTPGWSSSYPDFPRTSCFIGICTISFEGTNELTMNYLDNGSIDFAGIVMADFPGYGLIHSVIHKNTLDNSYWSYWMTNMFN